MLVTAVVAYPSGFGLSLITVSRLSRPTVEPWGPTKTPDSPDVLRFGIGFADGTQATDVTLEPHRLVEHDGCILMPIGGNWGGRKHSTHYWCEPLPPKGMMSFVCEWRAGGIPESEALLDAQVILDAASRAVPIWEDDVDLANEGPV